MQANPRRWRALSAARQCLLGACLALAACSHRPEVLIRSAAGSVTIPVEVADTPESRARGLMYRNDLPAAAGMLFIFPNETQQQFWMKNTPLPLDIVFIGKDLRIAGVLANARPFTTTPLRVEAPSQYVLEVHAGFCAQHGIAAGDRVEFRRVAESGA